MCYNNRSVGPRNYICFVISKNIGNVASEFAALFAMVDTLFSPVRIVKQNLGVGGGTCPIIIGFARCCHSLCGMA
jgi:hypothetical protein